MSLSSRLTRRPLDPRYVVPFIIPRTHDRLSVADPLLQLINALDPSLAGIAQPINDQIQGNFTATVNAFQGRGGAIKIPTKLVPALSDILDGLGRALGISDDTSSSGGGGKGAKGAEVDTNSNLLMPQISQSDLDKLGPDENDWSLVPFPVAVALRRFGFDG